MKRLHLTGWRFPSGGIVTLFLSLVLLSPAQAQLKWDQDKIELKPEIGQEVVHTAYSFTNAGSASVSIVSIRPSCGCVTTNLEKFAYEPGEGGTIKVTFDLGMDKGDDEPERTIKVVTSDAPLSPKILELKAHVHEAVSVSPEALVWRHGAPGQPQDVIVKAGSGIEAMQLVQTTHNDNFLSEVKPEVEGQTYRVTVRPKNTDLPCNASLDFNVKSPSFQRHISCAINLKVD